MSAQKVNAMAAELAEKPKGSGNAEAGDPRTYYALNWHAEAARAFERAVVLVSDNADLSPITPTRSARHTGRSRSIRRTGRC
jgi:hypothetical protein